MTKTKIFSGSKHNYDNFEIIRNWNKKYILVWCEAKVIENNKKVQNFQTHTPRLKIDQKQTKKQTIKVFGHFLFFSIKVIVTKVHLTI